MSSMIITWLQACFPKCDAAKPYSSMWVSPFVQRSRILAPLFAALMTVARASAIQMHFMRHGSEGQYIGRTSHRGTEGGQAVQELTISDLCCCLVLCDDVGLRIHTLMLGL